MLVAQTFISKWVSQFQWLVPWNTDKVHSCHFHSRCWQLYYCFLSGFHSAFSTKDLEEIELLGCLSLTRVDLLPVRRQPYWPNDNNLSQSLSEPSLLHGMTYWIENDISYTFLVCGATSFNDTMTVKIWYFEPKSGIVSSYNPDRKCRYLLSDFVTVLLENNCCSFCAKNHRTCMCSSSLSQQAIQANQFPWAPLLETVSFPEVTVGTSAFSSVGCWNMRSGVEDDYSKLFQLFDSSAVVFCCSSWSSMRSSDHILSPVRSCDLLPSPAAPVSAVKQLIRPHVHDGFMAFGYVNLKSVHFTLISQGIKLLYYSMLHSYHFTVGCSYWSLSFQTHSSNQLLWNAFGG